MRLKYIDHRDIYTRKDTSVLQKLDYGICRNMVDERTREDPERLTTSAGLASRHPPQQDHSGVILILPSSSLSNLYLHIFSPRWTFFLPPRLLPSCDSGFSLAGTNSMSVPLAAFPTLGIAAGEGLFDFVVCCEGCTPRIRVMSFPHHLPNDSLDS